MSAKEVLVPLLTAVVASSGLLGIRLGGLDAHYGARQRTESAATDELRSPGPEILAAVAAEHPLLWADLFWLGIVQEFGRTISGERVDFERAERWAHIATDLDPLYFAVYYATAIQLTVFDKDADASDALLMKGMKHIRQFWQFPFMVAYNAYFLRGDADRAADFWEQALHLPNVPRFVPSLAARSRFHAGDEAQAESMLVELIESGALDGPHLLDAQIRLKILRSEPILRAYDAACVQLRAERGVVPTASEIFKRGLVSSPPVDLLDSSITMGEDCRARSEQIRVREDEAAQRLGLDLEGDGPPAVGSVLTSTKSQP